MIRIYGALALLALVLVACGSNNVNPPRNIDNACSIVSQRPDWIKHMNRVERKWGVPPHVLLATMHQESKFKGDARTPMHYTLGIIPNGRQSSAYGYSQALDGTWKEYKSEAGRRFARRDRFRDAVDFMGWYMHKSNQSLGISKYDARNQYLAYHEGRTGYARGSYNRKAWLVAVAGAVATRADLYRFQLASCR